MRGLDSYHSPKVVPHVVRDTCSRATMSNGSEAGSIPGTNISRHTLATAMYSMSPNMSIPLTRSMADLQTQLSSGAVARSWKAQYPTAAPTMQVPPPNKADNRSPGRPLWRSPGRRSACFAHSPVALDVSNRKMQVLPWLQGKRPGLRGRTMAATSADD